MRGHGSSHRLARPAASCSAELPSVESLLASTAKLLSEGQTVTGSKLASLAGPTAGSMGGTDGLVGFDSKIERQAEVATPWEDRMLDSSAVGSQEGSPLIRAGRLQHFVAAERGCGLRPEPRDSSTAARHRGAGEASAGRIRKHSSNDVHRQLQELKSAIKMLCHSVASPAAGRARGGTKIPAPKATSTAPALLQPADPASEHQQGVTAVREPQRAEKVSCTLQSGSSQAALPAVAAEKPSSVPTSPQVSALFESLWDTDDDVHLHDKAGLAPAANVQSSPDQAGEPKSMDEVWSRISEAAALAPEAEAQGKPEAKRPKSQRGAHKQSAEQGTLNRKLRGLEAAWQHYERSLSKGSAPVPACMPGIACGLQPSSSPPPAANQPIAPRPSNSLESKAVQKPRTEAVQASVDIEKSSKGQITISNQAGTGRMPAQRRASLPIQSPAILPALLQRQGRRSEGFDRRLSMPPVSVSAGAGRVPSMPDSIKLPLPDAKQTKAKGMRLKFWKPRRYANREVQAHGGAQTTRSSSTLDSSRDDAYSLSNPEKPARSKDSFSKLTGLFRRRSSFSGQASPSELLSRPGAPWLHQEIPSAPSASPRESCAGLLPRTASQQNARAANPSDQTCRAPAEGRDRSRNAASESSAGDTAAPVTEGKVFEMPDISHGNKDAAQKFEKSDTLLERSRLPDQKGAAPATLATNCGGSMQSKQAAILLAPAAKLDRAAEDPARQRPLEEALPGCEEASASGEWLSPEKAIKNLLVPSWVPNKLPFSSITATDDLLAEDSIQSNASQDDLIAAVTPRLPVSKKAQPSSGTLVTPRAQGKCQAAQNSTGPQHGRLSRSASPEHPSGASIGPDAARNDSYTPSRAAVSLSVAVSLPVAPSLANSHRELVPPKNPKPAGLEHMAAPAQPSSQAAAQQHAKEGFFRSLFRRQSDGYGKPKMAKTSSKLPRRMSDGGIMPALGFQQKPSSVAEPAVRRPASSRPPNQTGSTHLAGIPKPESAGTTGKAEAWAEQPQESTATANQDADFTFAAHTAQPPSGIASSTVRRRVTDEHLDKLQRCFQSLTDDFDKLPPSRPLSRERQRSSSTARASSLPQAEFFEQLAGRARPPPICATGTAEAVPFIMRKLPSPKAEERTSAQRGEAASIFEALLSCRAVHSAKDPATGLRTRCPAAETRMAQEPSTPRQGSAQVSAPTKRQALPSKAREVSPFGRVRCEPERAVPFLDPPAFSEGPNDPLASSGGDSPVTQVEKQLKQSAGASTGNSSPQWRKIAERAVHGDKEARRADQHVRFPLTKQNMPVNEGSGLPLTSPRPEEKESTAVISPRPGPDPVVVVDTSKPAFPALRAYLGAKSSGQQSPTRNLAADPEIAACRGISALANRFESGRLVASNVAALAQQFNDLQHVRERTAAWAHGHAHRAPGTGPKPGQPVISLTASSVATALHAPLSSQAAGLSPRHYL